MEIQKLLAHKYTSTYACIEWNACTVRTVQSGRAFMHSRTYAHYCVVLCMDFRHWRLTSYSSLLPSFLFHYPSPFISWTLSFLISFFRLPISFSSPLFLFLFPLIILIPFVFPLPPFSSHRSSALSSHVSLQSYHLIILPVFHIFPFLFLFPIKSHFPLNPVHHLPFSHPHLSSAARASLPLSPQSP